MNLIIFYRLTYTEPEVKMEHLRNSLNKIRASDSSKTIIEVIDDVIDWRRNNYDVTITPTYISLIIEYIQGMTDNDVYILSVLKHLFD